MRPDRRSRARQDRPRDLVQNAVTIERDIGFEPTTLSLGIFDSGASALAMRSSGLLPVAFLQSRDELAGDRANLDQFVRE